VLSVHPFHDSDVSCFCANGAPRFAALRYVRVLAQLSSDLLPAHPDRRAPDVCSLGRFRLPPSASAIPDGTAKNQGEDKARDYGDGYPGPERAPVHHPGSFPLLRPTRGMAERAI
jgi:hypothetical protein